MKIGILGAGRLGQTLARLFVRAGHQVRLANSRSPESLAALVAELSPAASAGVPADLARFGELVVLATRWEQLPEAVKGLGPMAGRIVVDATNNRIGPNPEDLIDIGDRSSSEIVADLLPGARVVKAFNHQPIPALAELARLSPSEPRALFLAGDDPDARAVVAGLIRDIGAEPVNTGSLHYGGRWQNTGGPLAGHGRLLTLPEAHRLLADLRRSAPGAADERTPGHLTSPPARDGPPSGLRR